MFKYKDFYILICIKTGFSNGIDYNSSSLSAVIHVGLFKLITIVCLQFCHT